MQLFMSVSFVSLCGALGWVACRGATQDFGFIAGIGLGWVALWWFYQRK
jgi:hypothetical protein